MALSRKTFPTNKVRNYYNDVRSELRNGDVVLCSGTGFFSAMIQNATDSVWSHVAFVLRLDEIDRIILLESVESIGVRTVRLSKYLENYKKDGNPYPGGIAVIRHTEFESVAKHGALTQLSQFAIDQFGYPYDNDEIAKIAARIMASRIPFSKKQKKKIEPDSEYICSEYVARCYEEAGLKVKWNELGFIAPGDFADDPNFELVAVLQRK
ncbi:hypothetical protein [Pseudaquabacterium pictum]|nr:hypothetical protein [Rubrivivax pictus]